MGAHRPQRARLSALGACSLVLLLAARSAVAQIRLNQLQMLHAHNAYHTCPLPNMVAGFQSAVVGSFVTGTGLTPDALQYGYPSLEDLVDNYGVRSIELDVWWDPEGGRYGYRVGPKFVQLLGLAPNSTGQRAGDALFTPGFKVLHIPDLDFQTSCDTLTACLRELWQWSRFNPKHTPLMITIEYKAAWDPAALLSPAQAMGLNTLLRADPRPPTALATSAPVEAGQVAALEREILSVWNRSKIFTPDNFRAGHASLQERIAKRGWPAVAALRGRTVFRVFGNPDFLELYEKARPGGRGAVLFIEEGVSAYPFKPTWPNSTVFVNTDLGLARLYNATALQRANVTGRGNLTAAQTRLLAEQYRLALQGIVGTNRYFVRATADQDTTAARNNFFGFTNAVLAGGAQLVHTDYPNGWKAPCGAVNTTYSARIQQLRRGTWSAASLSSGNHTVPGAGARLVSSCNVVTAPASCTTWNTRAAFKLPSSCTCYSKI